MVEHSSRKPAGGRPTLKGCLLLAAPTLAGFGLIVLGFAYDVLFAGIPFQDPTPELKAQYTHHAAIAQAIELSGVCLLGLGLIIATVRGLWSLGRTLARSK